MCHLFIYHLLFLYSCLQTNMSIGDGLPYFRLSGLKHGLFEQTMCQMFCLAVFHIFLCIDRGCESDEH